MRVRYAILNEAQRYICRHISTLYSWFICMILCQHYIHHNITTIGEVFFSKMCFNWCRIIALKYFAMGKIYWANVVTLLSYHIFSDKAKLHKLFTCSQFVFLICVLQHRLVRANRYYICNKIYNFLRGKYSMFVFLVPSSHKNNPHNMWNIFMKCCNWYPMRRYICAIQMNARISSKNMNDSECLFRQLISS